MNFEYDINKSITNKTKHGVDFEEAKALFKDENLLVLPLKIAQDVRASQSERNENHAFREREQVSSRKLDRASS